MRRGHILFVISMLLLCSCSIVNKKDSFIQEKTEHNTVIEAINNDLPFKIKEINSDIVEMNDLAFDPPLKGVRYEIILLSEEDISAEKYTSYQMEVEANGFLKENLGPIQMVMSSLKTNDDGYLYSVAFETRYGTYSEDELESLSHDRDFQLFLNDENGKFPVEYQSSQY